MLAAFRLVVPFGRVFPGFRQATLGHFESRFAPGGEAALDDEDVAESGLGHEVGGASRASRRTAIDGDWLVHGVGDGFESDRHIGEGDIARARDMALFAAEFVAVAHINDENFIATFELALQLCDLNFGILFVSYGFIIPSDQARAGPARALG